MSADSWSRCPKCIETARAEYTELSTAIQDAYGRIGPVQYEELQQQLRELGKKIPALGESLYEEEYPLAHYYEFYMRDGAVHWNYSAECRECDFSVSFDGSHPFEVT